MTEPRADDEVVLAAWQLVVGSRTRSLEVVSDGAGVQPVEVRIDGKPVVLIDRPSANTGRRTGRAFVAGRTLVVHLTSPDDGTTLACAVCVNGHRLDPAEPSVEVGELATKAERNATWVVFGSVVVLAALAVLSEVYRHPNRAWPATAFLVGAWCLSRVDRRLAARIDERGWPKNRRRLARACSGGVILAYLAVFLILLYRWN